MEDFIGTIKLFAGNSNSVPKGWMLCNGQMLDKDKFQGLYSILGQSHGGSAKSFALPNLNGNIAIGADSNYDWSLGKVKGSATKTLNTANLPPFDGTLNVTKPDVPASFWINFDIEIPCDTQRTGIGSNNPVNNYLSTNYASYNSVATNIFSNNANAVMAKFSASVNYNLKPTLNSTTTTFSTSISDSPKPISLMQPSLNLHYIICVVGFSPKHNRRVLLPEKKIDVKRYEMRTFDIHVGSSSSKKKIIRINNPFYKSIYGIKPIIQVRNSEKYTDVFATTLLGDVHSEYFEVAICRIDGDSWAQGLFLTVFFNFYEL